MSLYKLVYVYRFGLLILENKGHKEKAAQQKAKMH